MKELNPALMTSFLEEGIDVVKLDRQARRMQKRANQTPKTFLKSAVKKSRKMQKKARKKSRK